MDIQQQLDQLYQELHSLQAMTEQAVRTAYNADSKEDILRLVAEDIRQLQARQPPPPEDSLIDYDALCSVLGLPRFA